MQPKTAAEVLFPQLQLWTREMRKGSLFYCNTLYQYTVLTCVAVLLKLDNYYASTCGTSRSTPEGMSM